MVVVCTMPVFISETVSTYGGSFALSDSFSYGGGFPSQQRLPLSGMVVPTGCSLSKMLMNPTTVNSGIVKPLNFPCISVVLGLKVLEITHKYGFLEYGLFRCLST
jgi:hypothetical protein